MSPIELYVFATITIISIALAILTIPHILQARIDAMQKKAWSRTYFDYNAKTWIGTDY